MSKLNILFIDPGPVYYPELPSFKDKFLMLSEKFCGGIITTTGDEGYNDKAVGNFTLFGFHLKSYNMYAKTCFFFFAIITALKFHRKLRWDCIVCYDPMFTGMIGLLIKVFTHAKLIIEVNSFNHEEAIKLHKGLVNNALKRNIQLMLSKITLRFADRIKLLTQKQKEHFKIEWRYKTVCFHDFVPTHYFEQENIQFSHEILCVGWPFYLKGMDILIKAFEQISNQYPEYTLHLIGYRVAEDARAIFKEPFNKRIIISQGMPYDVLKPYILHAYCLVLPSRTEGMGKVLLEAMAAKKPVIGANVGGIPELIEDGVNGYLFANEDVDDLSHTLERLLSDRLRARQMGEEGLKIIREKFSSDKYMDYFKKMMDDLLGIKK